MALSHPGRRGLFALGGSAMLAACSTPPRLAAVPRGEVARATVLGLPNERFYPNLDLEAYETELMDRLAKGQRLHGTTSPANARPINLLAVSGGGEDGAYGAGLLCGWTEHGGRPEFDLVTGVSTGALTAPFAFLGPKYDHALRDVYTNVTADDILRRRPILAAVFNDALADNEPLYKTISRYLNDEMLADIATAYGRGRLLLIGSTNLDAQVPVIWNVGAIAASGHPKALDIIRRVLLASAAIPGAFPPVMIDATLDGKPFQEMHVDGGAVAQAFLYPAALTLGRRDRIKRRQRVADITAYVIRNARLDPQWASVDRRTMGIVSRAVSSMIASSGYNDIVRIYFTTAQDDVGYRLSYIPPSFNVELKSPFDQGYMRELFDLGFRLGKAGYNWATVPPGVVSGRSVAG
jgi:predicted patatin/cPLA2 family phospholipase